MKLIPVSLFIKNTFILLYIFLLFCLLPLTFIGSSLSFSKWSWVQALGRILSLPGRVLSKHLHWLGCSLSNDKEK